MFSSYDIDGTILSACIFKYRLHEVNFKKGSHENFVSLSTNHAKFLEFIVETKTSLLGTKLGY